MSTAEIRARHIFKTYHLNNENSEVKRNLMILLLTSEEVQPSIQVPTSYEGAIAMGCKDIETFSTDLHAYVDQLCEEYDIR